MSKVSGILNTKISTKDQILVVALTAAITAAVSVPFALAAGNDANVSANSPTTSAQTVMAGESCYEAVAGSAKSAATTASRTNATSVNNSASNQSGNSGQGNANNTTGGSAAANGNNQSNTGGLLGVNAIAPISVLGNTTVSGGEISALNNPLQGVTASLPAVNDVFSGLGISL